MIQCYLFVPLNSFDVGAFRQTGGGRCFFGTFERLSATRTTGKVGGRGRGRGRGRTSSTGRRKERGH